MGQPRVDFAFLGTDFTQGAIHWVHIGLASDAKATAGIRTPDLQFTKLPL